VLWFVFILAHMGVQSTVLNHAQESLYVASCLAGVTGHSSHLRVYHQVFTFLVVMGHNTSDIMLP